MNVERGITIIFKDNVFLTTENSIWKKQKLKINFSEHMQNR